jgi:hypothetical protein
MTQEAKTKVYATYQSQGVVGSVFLTFNSFKFNKESLELAKDYISKEYCDGKTAVIINFIVLKDEEPEESTEKNEEQPKIEPFALTFEDWIVAIASFLLISLFLYKFISHITL